MPVALTAQSISKAYSARPLFSGICLTIDERERVGLIGPNGSGKSTLLKIMAGLAEPDKGTVSMRKLLKVAYLAQEHAYAPGLSIRDVVAKSLEGVPIEDSQRKTKIETALSKVGFFDPYAEAWLLSGGWQKRLALAAALVKDPDLLLLDEPTNHLDLDGVLWLEELLEAAPFGFVVVSHDRSFLENVSNRIIELNSIYRDGYLSVKGPYSQFLEGRQEYLTAQSNEQQNLASKVRREIAWLQRGARARQTKSQARIRQAGKLIESLEDVRTRNNLTASAVTIDFNASGRKTKELLVGQGIEKNMGGKVLFSGLDLVLRPGDRLGVLGTNGSGKTTLLRILAGQLDPDRGTIKRANDLKIVWFDQNRQQLPKEVSLREALSPNGDSVIYRGQSLHVASWARRFLFRQDQLSMPVSYLSGGEQARILIANLMLQPADILILDEPTNDLDIATLEVLEDSLEDFPGALVLVTHDRFMLDTISTQMLALDGLGRGDYFADYAQWESVRAASQSRREKASDAKNMSRTATAAISGERRPLSTAEKKELAQIGDRIEAAELEAERIKERMVDPKTATNHVQLEKYMQELESMEAEIGKLYRRWEDLEARN